ncbi:glycoside hydrolase family 1 protein [Enterococcus sp.]|uniref:glycoside hydrolase family 1 protein n=1 Tax=Enterococcus sp. TaxID=35783 RepID=UPI003C778905
MENTFFWGNSVSSMQTEGAWNEGGKGPSVYDIRPATENTSNWKDGIDAYHRYPEDFDIMKDLGMNMYRFQVSWSRVCPTGDGEFNEEGIAFYDQFIDELIARGIEPMLCLYHFDMPLVLAETYDGFVSKKVMDAFVRYGKEMIDRFGDKVKYWVTFNEQNLYSTPMAFEIGGVLSEDKSIDRLYQIQHHVMISHARIANYLHQTKPDDQIGGMIAYSEMYPEKGDPRDVFVARKWDEFINFNLLDAFSGRGYSKEVLKYIEIAEIDVTMTPEELNDLLQLHSDFLSFSYYCSGMISHEGITEDTPPNYYLSKGEKSNYNIPETKWGFGYDALGFRNIMNKMYQRYRLPIFPVENGIGRNESWNGKDPIKDEYRIQYHEHHLRELFHAIEIDGVEIMGYLGWGLIDIPSSQGDVEKRYGVVYVNRSNHDLKDMRRIPKLSYQWLKNVIQTNGEELRG